MNRIFLIKKNLQITFELLGNPKTKGFIAGKKSTGMNIEREPKEEKLPANYYQQNAEKILNRLQKFLENHLEKFLELSNQQDQKKEIASNIKAEVTKLFNYMPFIGDKNFFTPALVSSAFIMAIYRSLDRNSFTDEEFGKVLFEVQQSNLNNMGFMRRMVLHQLFLGRIGKLYQKRLAKKSKNSKYNNDIVFDFVSGKGEEFIYGFNFYSCPMNTFFKEQGLQNLMPYYCLTDYADADFLGISLQRTKTLSMGSELCNHRYFKDSDKIKGWEISKFADYQAWVGKKGSY